MTNNKLIAEFMGAFFDDNGMTRICGRFGLERVSDLNLKYHSSWDWLMPVVDKCFDIHLEHSDDLSFLLNDALLTTNIDEVYKAVVNFIKRTKKTNKQ